MAVATGAASYGERLELNEEALAAISRRARKLTVSRAAKTPAKGQRIEPGRGPSSSEALFAWRVVIDPKTGAQQGEAVALPMAVMAGDRVSVRMIGFRPAELLKSAPGEDLRLRHYRGRRVGLRLRAPRRRLVQRRPSLARTE